MTIDLNRATFRRLVQFQIVSFAASLCLALRKAVMPNWTAFDVDFTAAVDRHFAAATIVEPFALVIIAGLLVWGMASMVGLLWFRRWARFGFWSSPLAGAVVGVVIDGERPWYNTSIDETVLMANIASFGAILLLAYAKDYGAEWFAPIARVED